VTCSVEDCGRSTLARGWCRVHYHAWRKYGDPLLRKPRGRPSEYDAGVCGVPGCDSERRSNGLCRVHYDRARTLGLERSPEGIRKYEIGQALDILERYDLGTPVRTKWVAHAREI
jgi:hypothetical protein